MEHTDKEHLKFPPRNRLLARLPSEDWKRLAALLEHVDLERRLILHEWRAPMESVYFIETGLVSVSARLSRHQSVEVWLIGSEGMTAIPEVLGDDDDPPHRRIVQVGGSALAMSIPDFRRALLDIETFRKVLLRYVQIVMLQTSQSGACNAHHPLKERLARWLLLAHDGLESEELPVTHDMLSSLLGVRRASVSACLALLEEEGMIVNTRGLIRIADLSQLEQACCDCYRIIKRDYDRLLRV